METIQLTDEMVYKLSRFCNLPVDYNKEEEFEEAMEIINEINDQIFGKNYHQ